MTLVDFYSERDKTLAEAYKRIFLGSTKVSKAETIHMPRTVRRNYGINPGDELRWYAGSFDVDFPEEEIANMIIVIVKRENEEINID